MHVRAGNIHFDDIDVVAGVHTRAAIDIFIDRKAAHIGDNRLRIYLPQRRNLLGYHLFDARILQSDGVDHTHTALCDAWRRVAATRVASRAFQGYGAQYVEVIYLRHLEAETEGAACRYHGVVESDAAERAAQIVGAIFFVHIFR